MVPGRVVSGRPGLGAPTSNGLVSVTRTSRLDSPSSSHPSPWVGTEAPDHVIGSGVFTFLVLARSVTVLDSRHTPGLLDRHEVQLPYQAGSCAPGVGRIVEVLLLEQPDSEANDARVHGATPEPK